jgi:hypothetical protein
VAAAVPLAVPGCDCPPGRPSLPPAHDRRPDPHAISQIVYDDGCTARELDENEQRFLEPVCNMLGHDLEAVEG